MSTNSIFTLTPASSLKSGILSPCHAVVSAIIEIKIADVMIPSILAEISVFNLSSGAAKNLLG